MSKSPKKNPPSNSQAPTERKTTAQGKEQRDEALGSQRPQNPSHEGAAQMPIGWVICKFADVANVISGKNQREVESPSGNYPIYGSGGTFGRATDYLCEAGTTVIGRKGTINSPIFVNERFWNVDTAFGLFPIDPSLLVPLLLHYFCRLFDFSALDKSTTIPSLAKRDIETIPFPLPPLAEQHRIVAKIEELFSELDDGEESLRLARKKLGVYRQSLLKQAFEGKLTERWRKQNPHLLESPNQLLKRIQNERQARYEEQMKEWPLAVEKWEKSGRKGKKPTCPREPKIVPPIDLEVAAQLPVLPDSWCWGTTEYTCDVVRGGSPRPAGSPTFYDGDIPFLKVADLTRVEGPYVDLFTSTIKEAGLQKTRYIEPPVLMISNSGATLGVPRICRIAATFNDGIAAFLDLPPNTHAYYYYFWTSKTESLRNIDQGAAQPNLNTDLLKTFPVPLCSLPEQQEIVRLLDEQFTVIEQNEREIDAALKRSAALRQSILKKAFTGQLVPQDPTDEPASYLLERIRMERIDVTKKKRASPKGSEVLSSS